MRFPSPTTNTRLTDDSSDISLLSSHMLRRTRHAPIRGESRNPGQRHHHPRGHRPGTSRRRAAPAPSRRARTRTPRRRPLGRPAAPRRGADARLPAHAGHRRPQRRAMDAEPGAIYPALNLLEDEGLVTVAAERRSQGRDPHRGRPRAGRRPARDLAGPLRRLRRPAVRARTSAPCSSSCTARPVRSAGQAARSRSPRPPDPRRRATPCTCCSPTNRRLPRADRGYRRFSAAPSGRAGPADARGALTVGRRPPSALLRAGPAPYRWSVRTPFP